MDNEKVSTIEVKKYFLLANAGKKLFNPPERKSKARLEDEYNCIIDEIFGLNGQELDERITDKVRLARYNTFDWYRGKGNLLGIGPWPKMNSLDIMLTTGSIPDTAQAVKDVQAGKRMMPCSDEGEREKRANAFKHFLDVSQSIRENLDFVYERFPIILFPGGEVREKDYNTWAKENDKPLCKIFEHDLDDGNNRAVSYAMSGLQKAPCFYALDKQ